MLQQTITIITAKHKALQVLQHTVAMEAALQALQPSVAIQLSITPSLDTVSAATETVQ